jgi:opacity protein-like surface antigen
MNKQKYLPLLLLLALPALPAAAQVASGTRVEFTPFASFGFQGNFDDGFYDDEDLEDLEVDDANGYGLIVGFPVNRAFTVELSYSQQDTEIVLDDEIFGFPLTLVELDIEYLHVGATFNFGGGHVQPFLGISGGLTRFTPNTIFDDFDDETRFSAGISGGLKIYFTDNIGIRLQGRVLSTLIDEDEEAFCGRRECYYYEEDTYLYQGELAAGLIIAF